jgi:hypothetical protein
MRSDERRASSRTRPRAARGLKCRPFLEPLEDRSVPSSFTASSVNDLIADITAANNQGGSNTITLAPGTTFTLIKVDNTTDGATGLPVIANNDDLTIIGNNDTIQRSTAAGTPAFRLLDVADGANLELQDLTLQGGFCHDWGGAIRNNPQGSLTLSRVIVQNNISEGLDGTTGEDGGTAKGGGIFSFGSLTLDSCTIQNNQAIGGKGGKAVKEFNTRTGWDVYGGTGGDGLGGGVYVYSGTAHLSNCIVIGNNAQAGKNGSGGGVKSRGQGGGLYLDFSSLVYLDAFTLAHVENNTASTSNANIAGTPIIR